MADRRLTDPLGRVIVLRERTWYGHVIKGHPDMKGHRRLAEQAVRAPNQIQFSKSDPDCRIYYGPGDRPKRIIMVVADVKLGLVKTAHFARGITGGGVEWSTSSKGS